MIIEKKVVQLCKCWANFLCSPIQFCSRTFMASQAAFQSNISLKQHARRMFVS